MNEDLTKNLPSSDSERLTRIFATVQNLDLHLGSLEPIVGSLEQTVVSVERTVGSLEKSVVSLEQKVEERLYDSRPILEKVNTDIVQLQAGQQRLEEGQQRLQEGQEFLRGESQDVRTELREMFRKLSSFNDTLVTMQADYRDIADRVREIERQR